MHVEKCTAVQYGYAPLVHLAALKVVNVGTERV